MSYIIKMRVEKIFQYYILGGTGITMSKEIFGAVELGGTKTVVMVAEKIDQIIEKKRFPTLNPKETTNDIVQFFISFISKQDCVLKAVGIGSFGPLDLNPLSSTFGFITSTPKQGWNYFNIKKEIETHLNTKVYLDTDVNTSALGEYFIDPLPNIKNMVYITIGTGIGAGLIINGNLVHGLVHPEFGHIRIPHDFNADPFPGICPYHRDCFEGLASGPALIERWHTDPQDIPVNHIAWELEAEYISHALVNLICTVSPEMIVIGGGVMQNKNLYPMIQKKTKSLLNQYIKTIMLEEGIDGYIIPPRLKDDSGILGALCLAIHCEKAI